MGIDPDGIPEIQELEREFEEKLWVVRKKEDEVIITCPQCGHEYPYESWEKMEEESLDVRCGQCGCKYLRAVMEKVATTLAELERKVKRKNL